jgi:hypothetical protein
MNVSKHFACERKSLFTKGKSRNVKSNFLDDENLMTSKTK